LCFNNIIDSFDFVDKSTKFWPKTQISQNFATPPNFGTLIEIKLTKYAERIASDDRMEKVLSDCRVTAEAFYRSRTADETIPY
jgi:hypothetical protein